jgi:hypothetical protein
MTDSDNKPSSNSHFSLTNMGSEFGLLSASMSGAETNSDNKPVGNRHFSLTVKGSEFGMSSASMNGAMTDSDNKPSGNSHISLTAWGEGGSVKGNYTSYHAVEDGSVVRAGLPPHPVLVLAEGIPIRVCRRKEIPEMDRS